MTLDDVLSRIDDDLPQAMEDDKIGLVRDYRFYSYGDSSLLLPE